MSAHDGHDDELDDETVAAFKDCTLPPARFHHREHVLVAWSFLSRAPPADAARRFTGALARYASAHGFAEKYDEALTLRAFATAHPDLLDATHAANAAAAADDAGRP